MEYLRNLRLTLMLSLTPCASPRYPTAQRTSVFLPPMIQALVFCWSEKGTRSWLSRGRKEIQGSYCRSADFEQTLLLRHFQRCLMLSPVRSHWSCSCRPGAHLLSASWLRSCFPGFAKTVLTHVNLPAASTVLLLSFPLCALSLWINAF